MGERDPAVFRHIHHEFGGELALNCWVIRPGSLQVGAAVELVPIHERPARVGGWITGAPYQRSA
jgi:hypothetical protein